MSGFEGKVVLVTGGTSGIGKAVVEDLLAKKANVIVASRRERGLEECLTNYPNSLLFIETDVSDETQVAELFRTIETKYGRLDAAFNNAGIARLSPIRDITAEHFHDVINTNVLGVLLCMKYEIRLMQQQTPRGGVILNNASAIKEFVLPTGSVYGGSKTMVTYLSKVAAAEHVKDGIRVNSISPGYFPNTMLFVEAIGQEASAHQERAFTELLPNKQPGRLPELVASVIHLLSSPSYVNATDLVVDGGLVAFQGRF